MLSLGGPAQPSPTLGDALNAGCRYLEIQPDPLGVLPPAARAAFATRLSKRASVTATVAAHKRPGRGIIRPTALRAIAIPEWCASPAAEVDARREGIRLKPIAASGANWPAAHFLREDRGGDQRRKHRDSAVKPCSSHRTSPYLQDREETTKFRL
jgi:hypothetical protein